MSKDWYASKAAEHYALWEKALDDGDEKAAQRHMTEYLNYDAEAKKNDN